MKTIVFQGDSITDCMRNRENNGYGGGYAQRVVGHLSAYEPYKYTFYNRGISGNRVVDIYARMRRDIINLSPDIMSILVGVNDVWHDYAENDGVSVQKFEKIYTMMIEELKQELPDLKIMLLEPFVLPGSVTENTEEHPQRWEYFRSEVELRAQAVKRIAEQHDLLFIPLQQMFDEVNADAPVQGYWLRDGVHPTPAGYELITGKWLEGFEKLKG